MMTNKCQIIITKNDISLEPCMHTCWLSFCDMASSWLDSFQCFDMFWRPICQGGVNCMAWDATISFLGSLCWCDLHALSERTCIVVLAVIKRVYMLRHCSLRGHPAQDITCYTSATSPTCMIAHRGFDAAYLAITNSACINHARAHRTDMAFGN